MIAVGPATRVFLAVGVTDMRKGYDGLHALVANQLGEDPLSGHLFVFANRRSAPALKSYAGTAAVYGCAANALNVDGSHGRRRPRERCG